MFSSICAVYLSESIRKIIPKDHHIIGGKGEARAGRYHVNGACEVALSLFFPRGKRKTGKLAREGKKTDPSHGSGVL